MNALPYPQNPCLPTSGYESTLKTTANRSILQLRKPVNRPSRLHIITNSVNKRGASGFSILQTLKTTQNPPKNPKNPPPKTPEKTQKNPSKIEKDNTSVEDFPESVTANNSDHHSSLQVSENTKDSYENTSESKEKEELNAESKEKEELNADDKNDNSSLVSSQNNSSSMVSNLVMNTSSEQVQEKPVYKPSIRGEDVFEALQRMAMEKQANKSSSKNKRNMKGERNLEKKEAAEVRFKIDIDNVKPIVIKEEWGAKIESIENKLQEFKRVIDLA